MEGVQVDERLRQADLAIYAINLDRSTDRFEALQSYFGGQGWPLIRIRGLDARDEPEAVLNRRGKSLTDSRWVGWDRFRQRPFSITEEACYCGHLMALERFLDDGHAYGLILEDDALPVDGWADLLDLAFSAGLDFDVLKLEGVKLRGSRLALPVLTVGEHQMVRSLRPAAGAAAYVVTREAAKVLLKKGEALTTVYDYFLPNPSLHGLRVLYSAPWLVRQAGVPSLQTGRSGTDPRRTFPMQIVQLFRRASHRAYFLIDALDGQLFAWARAKVVDWAKR